MAGEFYFAAAKDAADGCGCSTPVADVLGLALAAPSPSPSRPESPSRITNYYRQLGIADGMSVARVCACGYSK